MTKVPPTERIASSFQRLSAVSTDLNLAANELNETISTLDEALKSLKLGVSAWHPVASNEEERDGEFWTRDIGYAHVKGRWRIALRKTAGNSNFDHYEEEIWAFEDAPRWMCIESIGRLPDLIDDLIKRTEETVAKIKGKTAEAKDLAGAIIQSAEAKRKPQAPRAGSEAK